MDAHPNLTDPDAPQPDRRGAFFMLFFGLMVIGAGNTMLIAAVIPPLTRELDLPDWMAGAIFSFSALCWSLTSPFWGKQSNRLGRRRVVALGLAGFGISMFLLLCFAHASLSGWITGMLAVFLSLALSRSVFGLLGSATNPAAQAYVADRTTQSERQSEIAFITSGFSTGTVVGPAFAAALVGAFGLLSPLMVTCVIAFSLSFMIWRFLPEHRPPRADAGIYVEPQGARGLWHSSAVLPFLVYAVCLSLVTGILTQVFVFTVMDKMGVEGRQAAQFTGPAFTVGAMAILLSQLVLIPRLKLKNRQLMVLGCMPLICGALMLIFAQDFASLVFAQFLIGLGQGLARPGFSSGASLAVSPALQGNVAGLVISANGMGFIVTPLFGLFLYEFVSPQLPFVICTTLLIAMALFAQFVLGDRGEVDEEAGPG